MQDDRTRTNQRRLSYFSTLFDGRPSSDMSEVLYLNFPAEYRAGRNVDVVSDPAVVFDDRTAVDNDIFSQFCTSVNNCPCQDLSPIPDFSPMGKYRGGVYYGESA